MGALVDRMRNAGLLKAIVIVLLTVCPCVGGLFVFSVYKMLDDGDMFGRGSTQSGWSAEWAGDLDGDGKPDILLCTPFEPIGMWPSRGRARAFSGATGKCILTIDAISERQPWTRLVIGAGDLDGDGRGDLLCTQDDVTNARSGLDGHVLHGVADDWGGSFAPAGDLDHDGSPDWFCSNPLEGGERQVREGRVRLISGRTGSVVWEMRGSARDELGWSVCGLGDMNGDGRADFAVSSGNDSVPAYARVFSGADRSLLRELTFPPGQFREHVLSAGDVDADGYQDLLLGSHGLGTEGIVRVYSGKDGTILHDFHREIARFGCVYDGVGDVDADGCADVIVGNWDDSFVFSGRTGEVIRDLPGATMSFGHADFDADGHADILVTRNVVMTRSDPIDAAWSDGSLEVISGRDGTVLLTIQRADVEALAKK